MTAKKTKPIDNDTPALPLEARIIQYITNFPRPATTQDNTDAMAAEFITASFMRTQADKRYEAIKSMIADEFESHVDSVRKDASLTMQKQTETVVGVEWQIDFSANRPAMKTDINSLRTELIKQGVRVEVIDDAINKVSKKATPALLMSAKRLV